MNNKQGFFILLTTALILITAILSLLVWQDIKSKPIATSVLEKRARGWREVVRKYNCVRIVEVRTYEGEKSLMGQLYEDDLLLEDGRRITTPSILIKNPGDPYCESSIVPVLDTAASSTRTPDASVPNTPLFDASVPNTQVFE